MAWWNPLRLFTPKPHDVLLEEVVDDAWKWYRDSANGSRGIEYVGIFRSGGHEALRDCVDALVRKHGLAACDSQLWSRHEQHATTYTLGEDEWLEIHLPPPKSSLSVGFELVNGGTPPEERRALIRDIILLVAGADYGRGYHGHPMAYPLPCVHFERARDKP